MGKYVLIYIAAISLLAVFLTIYDKLAAIKRARRVRERTLFNLSILGGSVAMLLTMLAIRHKTRQKRFIFGIPLIILLQGAFIVFGLNSRLEVSHYEIETNKLSGQVRLALITDLHSCDYGDNQIELLSAIDEENADIILLCGDIFDDRKLPDNTTQFIRAIANKYPCYYVSGNHDTQDEYKLIAESYDITVLEGTSEILELHGENIRICGIDDPEVERNVSAGRITSRSLSYSEQINRLTDDLNDGEVFTLLLSHRPERIEEFLALKPDVVLSGHAHGGQWRLPVLLENGLLAPNQGLFPKYTNGAYSFGDTTLFVSRGLAKESTKAIPRIFNPPEIVIITVNY